MLPDVHNTPQPVPSSFSLLLPSSHAHRPPESSNERPHTRGISGLTPLSPLAPLGVVHAQQHPRHGASSSRALWQRAGARRRTGPRHPAVRLFKGLPEPSSPHHSLSAPPKPPPAPPVPLQSRPSSRSSSSSAASARRSSRGTGLPRSSSAPIWNPRAPLVISPFSPTSFAAGNGRNRRRPKPLRRVTSSPANQATPATGSTSTRTATPR